MGNVILGTHPGCRLVQSGPSGRGRGHQSLAGLRLPFQGSNLLHRKAHRWRNWRSSSSCCALKEPCFWA